jgi:hypothetical protein
MLFIGAQLFRTGSTPELFIGFFAKPFGMFMKCHLPFDEQD